VDEAAGRGDVRPRVDVVQFECRCLAATDVTDESKVEIIVLELNIPPSVACELSSSKGNMLRRGAFGGVYSLIMGLFRSPSATSIGRYKEIQYPSLKPFYSENPKSQKSTMCCRKRAAVYRATVVAAGSGTTNGLQTGVVATSMPEQTASQQATIPNEHPPPYELGNVGESDKKSLNEKGYHEAPYRAEDPVAYSTVEPYGNGVQPINTTGKCISSRALELQSIKSLPASSSEIAKGGVEGIAGWFLSKREQRRARCAARAHRGCCKY
jgi:hypothetical protein